MRTQKKNYINGDDFLQYYKNNWTHYTPLTPEYFTECGSVGVIVSSLCLLNNSNDSNNNKLIA